MRRLFLLFRLCSPARSYAIFRFLTTVFLLFRRRRRWLLWRPLGPQALVETIRHLGASFLKLAQVLATRADFFDEEYLAALRQLHDRMPPMPDSDRRWVFRRAFPDPTVFSLFDDQPLASASIGQVHRARVQASGQEVAVKLLRRDMRLQVHIDIVLLNLFLRLFKPLFTDQTRHSIESVLRAFTQVIRQEVSMIRELANLEHFSQMYAHARIRFPEPVKHLCCDDALVMSFEQGVRIDNAEQIRQWGLHFPDLMEKLVLFYTEQMLVKGYFHADPHPGNLLVTRTGELVLLDFGMVSRIPQDVRQAMIYAVKAAYERDFELLISATRRMGVLTDEADSKNLSRIAEGLFDIFATDQLDASSMQDLAFGILNVLHDQPFKLPQDVIYVMRVSSLIEGLGTQYISNFNGIKDILPILKKHLPRALGEDRGALERINRELVQLPLTLTRTRKLVELAEQGELTVRMARADRQFFIEHFGVRFRALAKLIFFLALAFYFLFIPADWASLVSIGSLLLAFWSLRKIS